jgi:hypothetical protein
LRDKEIFRQALQGVAKYTRDLLVQKGVLEAKPVVVPQQKVIFDSRDPEYLS